MEGETRLRELGGRAAAALFAAVAALGLLLCAVINFRGFSLFATADMYADTLVSRLILEQKTLFPEGWVFGNQYYVFSTPVLAALFYGLTGSLNLSMVLATELMTALIIAAFLWMVRPFCSVEARWAGALGLLAGVICPGGPEHLAGQLFYLMASYYSGYLITLLVVCGTYIRYRSGGQLPSAAAAALSLALSFAAGLQSLRQTAVMVLPLLFLETASRLSGRSNTRATLFAFGTAFANIAGLFAIRLLAEPGVSIYANSAGESSVADRLASCAACLWSISGLKSFTWGEPVCGVFAIVLILCAASIPLRSLRSPLAPAAAVCALGVAAVLGIELLTGINLRSIYLFTWFPLVALGLCCLVNSLRRPPALAAVCLCLAALSLFSLARCYLPSARRAFAGEGDTAELAMADYAASLGAEYVYGPWDLAARVAVRTDGAVTAGAWHGAPLAVLGYINPQNIYTESDNSRAVYLVPPSDREAVLARAAAAGAELTLLRTFGGGVEMYTSSRQLMYFP